MQTLHREIYLNCYLRSFTDQIIQVKASAELLSIDMKVVVQKPQMIIQCPCNSPIAPTSGRPPQAKLDTICRLQGDCDILRYLCEIIRSFDVVKTLEQPDR